MLYVKKSLLNYSALYGGEQISRIHDLGFDLESRTLTSIVCHSRWHHKRRKWTIPISEVESINHENRTVYIKFQDNLNQFLHDEGWIFNQTNKRILQNSLYAGSFLAFHSLEDGNIEFQELYAPNSSSTFKGLCSKPIFDEAHEQYCGNLVDIIINSYDYSMKFLAIKKPFQDSLLFYSCKNALLSKNGIIVNRQNKHQAKKQAATFAG